MTKKTKKHSLNIFGVKYQVILKDPTVSSCGLCDRAKKVIYWDGDISTLLHEVFHALELEASFYQILDRQAGELMGDIISNCITANFHVRLKKNT